MCYSMTQNLEPCANDFVFYKHWTLEPVPDNSIGNFFSTVWVDMRAQVYMYMCIKPFLGILVLE